MTTKEIKERNKKVIDLLDNNNLRILEGKSFRNEVNKYKFNKALTKFLVTSRHLYEDD